MIDLNEAMEEYAKLPFEPLEARWLKKQPGNVQKGYTTNGSAFLFPLKGKAQFHLSENSFVFEPGKVIHGCPGQWLTAQNDPPVEFFALYYRYEGHNAAYMHCPYELETGINPRLFSMLQQLTALCQQTGPQAKLQAKMLVYSVLEELFSSAKSIRQTDAHSVVEDAKRYVEQHYMEPHTLFELGDRYGMCGKYFSDVFRRHTGIAPIEYLIRCRLEQAKRLLESTECSVQEIGKCVGYKDALYFSRQFKNTFGFSPSEHRERVCKIG